MDDGRHTLRNGIRRHAIVKNRECVLGVISHQDLKWTEHCIKILDLSVIGLGFEADHPIDPGIVWFTQCVYGQRCGFLVWCRKDSDRYRGGIQFLSLTREEEGYLKQQATQIQPCEPFPDPDRIIARLIAGIKQSPYGGFDFSG